MSSRKTEIALLPSLAQLIDRVAGMPLPRSTAPANIRTIGSADRLVVRRVLPWGADCGPWSTTIHAPRALTSQMSAI